MLSNSPKFTHSNITPRQAWIQTHGILSYATILHIENGRNCVVHESGSLQGGHRSSDLGLVPRVSSSSLARATFPAGFPACREFFQAPAAGSPSAGSPSALQFVLSMSAF